MPALHDIFIALHATGALVAFVAGIEAILPSRTSAEKRSLFRTFAVGLGVMIALVLGAIVADWPALALGQRILFPALFALALYMAYRGRLAATALRQHPRGRGHAYIEHVGFDLISLAAGFVIVAALDLGVPWWLVVAIAVGVVIAGRRVLVAIEGEAAARRRPRAAAGAR